MYYPLAKGIMPIMLLPIPCPLLFCSEVDKSYLFRRWAYFLNHQMTEALLCKAMTIWLMTIQRLESSLWCETGWPDLPLIIKSFPAISFHVSVPLTRPLSCWTIWDLMVKPQFGGLNICHEVTSDTSWDHSRKKDSSSQLVEYQARMRERS